MTRGGDASVARGRLRKANQFYDAAIDVGDLADDEEDVRDAVVTLLVHAGIAAADVVCILRLGEYALGNVLSSKTKAGYTHRQVSADDRRRAERAAATLVDAARSV